MAPPRRRNETLRALLAEARWPQAALARAVNALAAEIDLDLNYDRTAVAHWLSGTRPAPPVPELIAEAFTRRLGRVVSPATMGLAGGSATPAAGRRPGFSTPIGAVLTELCSTENDPARRAPARLLPYREAELAQSARSAGPEPRAPHGAFDADDDLGVVRLAVRFFSASFDGHGGQRTRSALAAYLADDIAPLLREQGDGAPRRGLLVEASRLSFLLSQLAVAQAACGRHRSARASMADAEGALAKGAGVGTAEPFTAYSPGSLEFQQSEALRYTGDLPAARTALANSLAHRSTADHRGMALSHAQLAEILVGLGHVEEACAAWNSFLDHYAQLHSGSADQAAGRMRQLLTPFRKLPAANAVLYRAFAMTSPSAHS